jgi:hypothetical protein
MAVEASTEQHNTKEHVTDISHRLVWLSYFYLFMIIFFKLRYIWAALHDCPFLKQGAALIIKFQKLECNEYVYPSTLVVAQCGLI